MSVLLVQPHGKVIVYLLIRLSNHSQCYATLPSAYFHSQGMVLGNVVDSNLPFRWDWRC